MILKNGNTSLRTINRNDIAQIRTWRNQESVNRYLVNAARISEEEQEKWFDNIDYSNSIYFMMEEASATFGVIYAHNISLRDKSFEGSIFTGNQNDFNTQLPVKAGLMLTIFFFDRLRFDCAFSKAHHKNKAALDLDRRFGFKELKREDDFIISRCSKADFETHTLRLRKSLLKNQPIEVILEKGDEKFSFHQ